MSPAIYRARPARLAGSLLRAVLAFEWIDGVGCATCRGTRGHHGQDCQVDAALTATGLETQAKRDAVRTSWDRSTGT
jgi:hypothetical protein